MVKIKSTQNINITYKDVEYSFKYGDEYIVEEDFAKMLIEGNYASYGETKNVTKSKKTDDNIE